MIGSDRDWRVTAAPTGAGWNAYDGSLDPSATPGGNRRGRHRRIETLTVGRLTGLPPRITVGVDACERAPEVPFPLLEQLAEGGRLVIPVGTREEQDLLLVTKKNGKTTTRSAAMCRFVPLRGSEGWRD